MFTWIQKHQQVLLIIILVIVVIAFVWLYNPINDPRQLQQNQVGKIYGQPVTIDQFNTQQRKLDVAMTMGLYEMVSGLAGPGLFSGNKFDQDASQRNFAWNLIVLRKETERLQISPTVEELTEAVKALPIFQENGQYSEAMRAQFVENQLGPRGFSWAQAEQIVADNLRLQKLQDMLGATAVVDPVQPRQFYEFLNRQTLVQVARMSQEELVGEIEVTDEEIAAYYAGNKAGFMSKPQVTLDYVRIPLPQPEAPAAETDAEADAETQDIDPALSQTDIAKLQEVRDAAQNFAVDLYKGEQSFKELAQEYELEVLTTEKFEVGNAPDPLSGIPNIDRAITPLSPEAPSSDVLATDDAYYVLHLNEMQEPQQLEMEAVRDQIVAVLKAEKIGDMTIQRSAELKAALEEGLKAGQEFEAKAEELGLEVATIPAFTLNDPPSNVANIGVILQTASQVAAEKVSDWQDLPNGGMFIYVAQREAAPVEQWETERPQIRQQLKGQLQSQMLQAWLESQRKKANFEPLTIQG